VVTAAVLVLIGALSIALAGAAQATRPGRPGATTTTGSSQYLLRVTVAPGQTLWSIAEADDPRADTRLVIQDILQMNSLSGDQVQPGQVLWVPRG
jgi:LysM repeat protein